MALSIRNDMAEKLARAVANETGETLTQAITHALEERWARLKGRKTVPDLQEKILNISRRCRQLPDQNVSTPEEILGYDQNGGFDS